MYKNKYKIEGCIVEIDQVDNYYRIIGDLRDSDTGKVIYSGACFQVPFNDYTFWDSKGAKDAVLKDNITIENFEIDPHTYNLTSVKNEVYNNQIILISKQNTPTLSGGESSIKELVDYLGRKYVAPNQQATQNIVTIQGVVVHKSDDENILRIMTGIKTPHTDESNPISFQCFEVQLSKEAYNQYLPVSKQIRVGDVILVVGKIYYIDRSYKFDKENPQNSKKIMMNVEANHLVKIQSFNGKSSMIEKCIQEYLKGNFRIGTYGDQDATSTNPVQAY